ncbi:MAG: hypothetical protein EXR93_10190 [Gemmatimonadetes bacterium]|nr:hypothetical protein [Gemmatimonadota bacterium]
MPTRTIPPLRDETRGIRICRAVGTPPANRSTTTTTTGGPRGGGNSTFQFGGAGGGTPTRLDLASLPVYTPVTQPLGVLIQRAMPDLVILALYATVAFLAAFARFLKYDVR